MIDTTVVAGNTTASPENGYPCFVQECKKPNTPYSRVLPLAPRLQWLIDGGYCGSLSIQSVALLHGAWISQAEVRRHGRPGGGHDNEVVDTNIAYTLDNLKLRSEGWDYKAEPTPQVVAYMKGTTTIVALI